MFKKPHKRYRIASLATAAVLTLGSVVGTAPTAVASPGFVVDSPGVDRRLYNGPGMKWPVVGEVTDGDRVTGVCSAVRNGETWIETAGGGWMKLRYLDGNIPIPPRCDLPSNDVQPKAKSPKKAEVKPASKPDSKAEVTPDSKAEVTPDSNPKVHQWTPQEKRELEQIKREQERLRQEQMAREQERLRQEQRERDAAAVAPAPFQLGPEAPRNWVLVARGDIAWEEYRDTGWWKSGVGRWTQNAVGFVGHVKVLECWQREGTQKWHFIRSTADGTAYERMTQEYRWAQTKQLISVSLDPFGVMDVQHWIQDRPVDDGFTVTEKFISKS